MLTIKLTRDHHYNSMIPRTGQVAGCGTVPAGKAVTVWGTPTRAERDLGVLHGTYRVKVTDPADPDWHVGTWLMNFQPVDWTAAGVLTGFAWEERFGGLSAADVQRCEAEYASLAAEIGI